MQDETKYETLPIAEMTNGIILANYENTLSGYCVLPLWLKEPHELKLGTASVASRRSI